MGSKRQPLDLVDIRKEQRRCAALLRYNGPEPIYLYRRRAELSNLQVKPSINRRRRSYDTRHVPANDSAMPWKRDESSGRSRDNTFEECLRLSRQLQVPSTKSGVSPSFVINDASSRKVLEKLRTHRLLSKDCNSLDPRLEKGEEQKLRRRLSIVTIADQSRVESKSAGVERISVHSRTRSPSYGLSLRLEPTSHGRELDEFGDHDHEQENYSAKQKKSITDNCLFPFPVLSLSVHSQSMKSGWRSSDKNNNKIHEVTSSLHRNPSALKRHPSILQRDSYNAALVQARRRLIHNGLHFGDHVTREFTYSYFAKRDSSKSKRIIAKRM
jgi:hypothetical protein